MSLDPVIQEIIKSLPPNDFETLTPEEFRIGNGDYSEGGGEDVEEIEDLNLFTSDGQDMAIRIYRPEG